MRVMLVTLCAAVAALLLVRPAWSETKTIRMSGEWELFGGKSSDGTGVCGVSTAPQNRYFGLKVFSSRIQEMVIHVGGKGFRVAKDQRANMRMQADARPAWTGVGKGFTFDDGDPGIEWIFTGGRGSSFFADLLSGGVLRISWPDAGIPDWTYSLAGTGTLKTEFDQCLRTLR